MHFFLSPHIYGQIFAPAEQKPMEKNMLRIVTSEVPNEKLEVNSHKDRPS